MKPPLTDWFFPHARQLFGGGGGGGSQAAQQIAATPAPAASPPVTAASAQIVQEQQDLRRQALKKKGFSQTIFAGDTGGWFAGNTTPGPTNPKTPQTGTSSGARTLGG